MQSVLIGSKGMGKSTLGLRLAQSSRRYLIVDPRKEHAADYRFDSLADIMGFYRQGFPPEGQSVVYSPFRDAGDYTEYFFEFCSALSGHTIFIDEVDQFCSAQQINAGLKKLINYQRHYNVNLIMAARRPAAVHRDVTALADEIYFFHTHENNDLRYIANLCGLEFASTLRNLKCGEFKKENFPPL